MKNKIMYVELIREFGVMWGVEKVGYGNFYFYTSRDDKKIHGSQKRVHCSNEYMSKEFIKSVLCKMVDDCILDDVDAK